jgi:EAL domain-containing protein (putative c-di-GMP-specific phosphodiesterase class I)
VAELVRRASLSARRAAEHGVALVRWDGDQGALTAADLELLADLRQAPARGQFTLAYQPQVSAQTGAVEAVEALLRWEHPVHGPVSPGQFIPLAERTGVIDELTGWVLGEALDAQVRWRGDGLDLPVSVNLSAKSLASADLPGQILAELSARQLPHSCLTVEVTETAVADPDQALAVLRPLHQQGVRISIDDFGTGFTSLALLPTLPLDELKVDQSFVLRSASSPADEAIVRTVGELAHRLGLQVVAEGVETAETAVLLRAMGIDLLQGYHFARPMPEADLVRFVTQADPVPSRVPTTMVTPTAGRPRTVV